MIGAIIGDIAGSRFEWANIKTKDFKLFTYDCDATDDSIMSLAVARAILDCKGNFKPLNKLSIMAVQRMQEYGRRYPYSGYGKSFMGWLMCNHPRAYNSFGNGAAMRVSPCGFAAGSLKEAEALAIAVTRVTHDHPEGLKAAKAVASAIYLARTGKSMPEIRDYIAENYYKIDFILEDIRPAYAFDVTCQGSVPQAFEAFFESRNFEDAVRNAVSIGGDSDTIAAIAGSMAEAYYGVPAELRQEALKYLDKFQIDTLNAFETEYGIIFGKA